MASLEDLPPATRQRLTDLDCPTYGSTPFVTGLPLDRRRVAIVTSAAQPAGDMVMTHVSVNFDRTGFQRDINIVYPLERLRDLAGEGVIGSVADTHYSVMGANDPATWSDLADRMVESLREDRVDAVVLAPV